MAPEDRRGDKVRRRRIALSVVAIVFGVLMLAATPTDFGPSPSVGLVFGGAFVVYGGVRLYQALRV